MDRPEPAFTRHVRDAWGADQLPELIEAAEAVEQTLASPGWAHIERILHAEIATIDRVCDTAREMTLHDYAKAHGRRGALRSAEEAAKAIIGIAEQRRVAAEARQAQATQGGAGESGPQEEEQA